MQRVNEDTELHCNYCPMSLSCIQFNTNEAALNNNKQHFAHAGGGTMGHNARCLPAASSHNLYKISSRYNGVVIMQR